MRQRSRTSSASDFVARFTRRPTVLVVAGPLVLALALAGCSAPLSDAGAGSPTGGAAAHSTILGSVPVLTNEYFQMWDRGGSEAAPAFNADWRMQSYNGDAATQIDQMRSASSAGISQVITFPVTNDAVGPIGEILGQSKIPWATSFAVTAWSTPSEKKFAGFYATLNMPREVAGTKALSEAVFKNIGGKGNVIYLAGPLGDRTSVFRHAGFTAAAAEFPGIKVLEEPIGGGDGAKSREVMQAMLSKYNNIDAVITHNSTSALGAVSVLEEAGNTHVKVGGTDETQLMLNKLIAGPNVVAVQSIFGTWLAGYLVARNYDALHGVKLDPLEHMMFQDSVVLDTKEAAKAYLGVETATKTGFNWAKMSRALHPQDWETQIGVTPVDPTPFFEDLKTPRPAGFTYPADLQASLDAGNLDKLAKVYAAHVGSNPYAKAISLTSTGKTVMGNK